jgi:2-oxoisovalerate dehydrogenase E1 component alpha subunit
MDFIKVHQVIKDAADRARQGSGPTLIETKTYRITPHSSDDDDRTYRLREEVEEYKKRDPILLAKNFLLKEGVLTEDSLAKMEERAKQEVNDAVRFAESAPYPDPDEALEPVYAEGGEPCLQ